MKYKCTNPDFGEGQVFEAPSKEFVADDMRDLFAVWAIEQVLAVIQLGGEYDENDTPEKELEAQMRVEFIASLEEVKA